MKKQMCFEGKIISIRRNAKSENWKENTKEGENNGLNFYWERGDKKIWLFSQKYTPGVHEQFRNGMRDFDIRNFKKWKRNPRLDKTIDKIPVYVAYAIREIA